MVLLKYMQIVVAESQVGVGEDVEVVVGSYTQMMMTKKKRIKWKKRIYGTRTQQREQEQLHPPPTPLPTDKKQKTEKKSKENKEGQSTWMTQIVHKSSEQKREDFDPRNVLHNRMIFFPNSR